MQDGNLLYYQILLFCETMLVIRHSNQVHINARNVKEIKKEISHSNISDHI